MKTKLRFDVSGWNISEGVLVLILLTCAAAWAQNSPSAGLTSIKGRARDATTHAQLANVIVTVDSQNAGNAAQAETDGMGKFDFEGLEPAVYIVKIRVPGYREESERLDLTVSGSNYVDFELKPLGNAPAPLPGGSLSARDAAVPEKARREFTKGRQLLEEGKDLPGSIEHLLKATQIYPKYADAYLFLGVAYMQSNDAAGAKTSLQKAVEADPKLAPAYIRLGVLFNSEKDYPAAEKTLNAALGLNPDLADAQYELGRTYWAQGRWQDAEPHAVKAAALMPAMPPVHVLLGNIQLRKNDGPAALKEFQEYLKLDPTGPFAAGAKTMVDKLQKTLQAQ